MRPGAFAVFVACLVVLHFLLHIGFGLGLGAPDFLAVAVLLAARRTSATKGALLGLLLGFLDDALGIRNLGARSLALGLAAVLGTWSRRVVEGDGLLFIWAYLFAGKWLSDIALRIIAPVLDVPDTLLRLITVAPIAAAYTALAGVLAFHAFRSLMGPDA